MKQSKGSASDAEENEIDQEEKENLMAPTKAEQPKSIPSTIPLSKLESTADISETWHLKDFIDFDINKKAKCILFPLFVIIGIISLLCLIMHYIRFAKIINEWILIGIICGTTILGCFAGTIGVYRFGLLEDMLDFFAEQNEEYKEENEILDCQTQRVKNEVLKIDEIVQNLQKTADELRKNLEAFDELKNELEKVCGKNEHLLDMLTNLNKQYSDMQAMMIENEKSQILSFYYDIEYKNGEKGLDRNEYKRFLAQLKKEIRDKFEKFGGFDGMDTDKSDIVDFNEFYSMVEKVLADVDEQIIQLHKQ